jgi:hypothetical protein
MKTLTSAAVFGLIPVPPTFPSDSCSHIEHHGDNGIAPATTEDAGATQLGCPQREDATERMATKGELASIRRQLEDESTD